MPNMINSLPSSSVDQDARAVMIAVRDITKSFGSNFVLDHVSLTLRKGEVVEIIGPSGSDKSTASTLCESS